MVSNIKVNVNNKSGKEILPKKGRWLGRFNPLNGGSKPVAHSGLGED